MGSRDSDYRTVRQPGGALFVGNHLTIPTLASHSSVSCEGMLSGRTRAKAMSWHPTLRPERNKYDHRRVVAAISRFALPPEFDLRPGAVPAPPSTVREFQKLRERLQHRAPKICEWCRRPTDQVFLSETPCGPKYVCVSCAGPMV